MDPISIAIIGGLATTAVNAYAAYQKGEISRAEYERAVQSANELERKLKTLRPDESWQDIKPELLQEAAKYSPDISAFVQENAPQLITEAGSETEKRVQREALQKYAALSESGRDVIAEAQREQALFEADARAKARRERLLEGLKRQGQLGTGGALVSQLQGEQAEQQAARQEALQGVQQAELRRREALGQAASLAGSLRGQALQVESANVGTMNAYNQRLANARNLYNQYASGERNEAQRINQARDIARQQSNLELANRYAMYNREQALTARERARQFDVNLANRMFDVRQGAEAGRVQAERERVGDYGTAITSGIGVGTSLYSGLSSAGAANAKADYLKALGTGAAQGGAQYATQRALQLQSPEETDFEMRIKPGMPSSNTFDPYLDNPEALDEYGNPDWRKMQARARRNRS
jgi:hypothetical protein